jgi:hypothetical protein
MASVGYLFRRRELESWLGNRLEKLTHVGLRVKKGELLSFLSSVSPSINHEKDGEQE